ncbi:MAG: YitT family protein [Anaerolineales bacterium]|nr:YitT family protein [Anaerolineales bacterium]
MRKYWPSIRDYALLVAGALLQALGLRLFLVPARLASGGVSGISQLINHYTGWPIGLMVFIGNVPLFLIGWRFLGGKRFALRTAVAVVSYSLFVDLLLLLPFFPNTGLTDDLFLNSLYGAVVSGIGYGLVYRGQGTSGGSDILARILNHWRGISMSQSYLAVDGLVILAAGFIFTWKNALYALVTLYISGIVAETTLEGTGAVRTAMIVTAQPEPVARQILECLERGVTVIPGKGAYTGAQRTVLYCVVNRSQVAQLKAIVQEADPQAFMVIGQAHEALGEGFRPLTGSKI